LRNEPISSPTQPVTTTRPLIEATSTGEAR
jgi:hypothetical protein